MKWIEKQTISDAKLNLFLQEDAKEFLADLDKVESDKLNQVGLIAT